MPDAGFIEVHVQATDWATCDNAVVFTTSQVSDATLDDVVFHGPARSVAIVPKRIPTSLIEFPEIVSISSDLKDFNVAQYTMKVPRAINVTSRSEFSFTVDFIEKERLSPEEYSSGRPLVIPDEIDLRVVPPREYTLAQAIPPSESMDASTEQGAYRVQLNTSTSDFFATFRSQIAQQEAELRLVIWSTLLGIGIGLVLEVILGLMQARQPSSERRLAHALGSDDGEA